MDEKIKNEPVKRKKLIIRMERHKNLKRTPKSMVAVLQCINIYHRILFNAQSRYVRIAKWGPPVKQSPDLELIGETLFVKEKRKQKGLYERLGSVNRADILEDNSTMSRRVQNGTEAADAFQTRARSCKRNKMYDSSIVDNSESDAVEDIDDDDDFDSQTKRKKKSSIRSWLGNKFSKTPKKSNPEKEPGLDTHLSDTEEKTNSSKKQKIEEVDGEPDNEDNDSSERKEDKNSFGTKIAKCLKGFRIPKLNRKQKRELESDVLIVDSGGEDNKDNDEHNEENDSLPPIPNKRRKKQEESLHECPMCQVKFTESEINEHAFTCNGEPPRAARSRTQQLDQSFDFIPLAPEDDFFSAASRKKKKLTDGKNEYSEWKNACLKVHVGESKTKKNQLTEPKEVNYEGLFKTIVDESASLEEDNLRGKRVPPIKPRRQLKTVTNNGNTNNKAPKMEMNNVGNWISDDSETEEKNQLVNQYLGPGKARRNGGGPKSGTNARGRRPCLDEDDSIDENEETCFICKTKIPKTVYEQHVMHCIAEADMKSAAPDSEVLEDHATKQKNSEQDDYNETEGASGGLRQGLENQSSWTHFDKTGRDGSSQYLDADQEELTAQENEDESPIKSFKPVGKSSLFDFDNQFKNNMPKRKRNLSRTYGRKKLQR